MPVDACVRVASTSVRALILVECRTLVISMPQYFLRCDVDKFLDDVSSTLR